MATPVTSTVCSLCGKTLEREGACLACLLRGGLDEDEEEPLAPSSLVFGDFEVERRDDGSCWELGRGAMGVTYRARDRMLRRSVALKVIEMPAKAEGAHATRERFLREARAAATLRHANVASVFQIAAPKETGRCYYAMELVEGETLAMLVRRDGPLPVATALDVAIQVTRALVAAAAHGLIHRDLKPANIMLAPNDAQPAALEAKVIDFGLAKATAGAADEMDLTHGGFVGTPTFASPEQFAGKAADARSDIYSLGVTLWYALTGEVPYEGKTIEEIRHCQSDLPLPVGKLVARKIPRFVIDLLRRVLAVDPTRRPGSARELMEALEACRSRLGLIPAHGWKARQIGRKLAALGAVVAIAGAVFFAFWLRGHKAADPAPALAKSIAVLPFENISEDKGNAYLADGIQDEIRTRLAKIADLKVISRTSTQNYKSKPGNLSEIAKQLGVANILEGSVQKSGEAVHITVQLISARDDSHLWAESYDRELRNIFSVEREVAETVATQLKAKLVPQEATELARLPTTNPQAYDLYLRARYINQQFLNGQVDSSLAAVDFCRQAIALDPGFALAYALLARTELRIYLVGEDRSLERIANARANAEKSLALQPDLIEGHLARASIYTYVKHDYANALVEYESLLKRSPNDSELNANMAFANGRAGNWQAKLTGMLRACELDPRNSRYLRWMASTCAQLRRYPEAEQAYEKALALTPDDWFTRANSAWNLILQGKLGDAREALKAWPDIKLTETALSMKYSHLQWIETLSRNYDAALANGLKIPVLGNRFPTVGISVGDIKKNTDNGFDALYKGDATGAHQAFTAARDGLESQRAGQLDDPQFYNAEALVAAGMDNREAAVNAARKALALAPIESDAYYGTDSMLRLAQVYAHFGEADQAVPLIRKLLDVPGTGETITPALLRLDPIWDPLRNDPRFQALLKDYPAEGGKSSVPRNRSPCYPSRTAARTRPTLISPTAFRMKS